MAVLSTLVAGTTDAKGDGCLVRYLEANYFAPLTGYWRQETVMDDEGSLEMTRINARLTTYQVWRHLALKQGVRACLHHGGG
jgi:hypothetical protein